MANYHGLLKGGSGSFASVVLGGSGDSATGYTVMKTSSAGNSIDLANINKLTASYAKITELDVVTLNSITQTQENLNVSASLIVASDGAGASNEADGSGLYISGANASLTWDDGNSRMAINKSFYGSAAAEFGGNVTAVGSFIIGSADLNEADMEKIDGITDGTVAANKAVVVDANKDADGFRHVTSTGAITAGTSFIIGSADLNEADMEKLDGITDGAVAASKAVVVDSNKDASGFRNITLAGMSGSSTLEAVGAATLGSTLGVSGAATFSGLISSNAGVKGTSYSGSTTLEAVGAARLGSTLSVTGAASFASYISASSYVSASSFSLGENSATIEYSDALDLSLGSTKYAALSTDYFSASVELQGPTVHSSGSITAGTSFIIGSADLNEADMEKLDGITNGSVAANKAVVVDGNADASGFRNVTGTGAITAGTSFIIGSADLNEADMEKLDGITDGAGAANKALVLDGNADIASGLRSLTGSGDLKFVNAHLSGDLYVADDLEADAATFSGLVSSNAGVKGTSYSGSSTLIAMGAANLGSTLGVSGAATFAGNVQTGKLFVTDKLSGSSDAEFVGSVKSIGNMASSGSITAGSSFIIGSADINETDLEKIDGITNGTVAAAKAVVVDSNKDASGFRNVTAEGSFIIGSADLNETDMEKIDGITNGAGAANKALVLDASADVASGLRSVTGSGDLKFVNAHLSGDLYVADDITADAATFSGLVSTNAGAKGTFFSGSSTLQAVGAATLGSTLNVSGAATMNAITATSVAGTSFSGSSTLQAVGATTLGSTLNVSGAAVFASTGEFGGHLTPGSDSTYNLGSTAKRWANIYTGDLHLKNERGNWTIFEEADHLRVRNNLTGKMYKMGLTPLSED